ncbi:oxyanion-translocating ATPase [Chamaesiphon minutus]|uniref:Oxyanion-translocating ATPase n=1 Tax=Chamaesiphon minutus (strain ATCC 27169 / PCC 6605) TaxID=1173020 RepID=K9UQ98_CHAP6|nr:oxyanion-translocating ATPase [Chamaesiphon minutus]AFY97242.1 oxyanion-translocating ATPase [Chamaesiphon minutus PCC 6605]
MNPIYMIGGGKGGVGKSIVSMALVDYLCEIGKDCYLIETDTSNPDVFKSYGEAVPAQILNLDKANGWIDLVNLCEEHRDKTIVINGAARSNDGVSKYGENLRGVLKDLDRSLITFWTINMQRDSVELLKQYMEVMQGTTIHVVRNGMFGDEDEFALYNSSGVRKAIEKQGKSLMLGELAERVSRVLYNDRRTIAQAIAEMPLGNKAELLRWRGECKKMFDLVVKL